MSDRFHIYRQVIEAWKAKDIDAVLSHLSPDIVWHYAAAIAPPARGHEGARKFLEAFGKSVGEVRWRVFHHAESGDRLFVEGVDEYITQDGRRVLAPYAGVLEFKGNLICGWRDYVDANASKPLKPGTEPTPQVAQLIDRPAIG
jgi:limonene-1,2-epoxide hydrolase